MKKILSALLAAAFVVAAPAFAVEAAAPVAAPVAAPAATAVAAPVAAPAAAPVAAPAAPAKAEKAPKAKESKKATTGLLRMRATPVFAELSSSIPVNPRAPRSPSLLRGSPPEPRCAVQSNSVSCKSDRDTAARI
jgi:hypothetical protein